MQLYYARDSAQSECHIGFHRAVLAKCSIAAALPDTAIFGNPGRDLLPPRVPFAQDRSHVDRRPVATVVVPAILWNDSVPTVVFSCEASNFEECLVTVAGVPSRGKATFSNRQPLVQLSTIDHHWWTACHFPSEATLVAQYQHAVLLLWP